MSDLPQGERRGPEAGHGAGIAGAGNNSARGCKCTKGDGADTARSLETACNVTKFLVASAFLNTHSLWRTYKRC